MTAVPTDNPVIWQRRSNRTVEVRPAGKAGIDVGIWGHHFIMSPGEAQELALAIIHAVREAKL